MTASPLGDSVELTAIHPGGVLAKILVIDDEDVARRLIVKILEDADYRVIATADATQAVALAKGSRPDLILCDIAMPVMDGYDVVRALQADPATVAYPVAFLTARQGFTEKVNAFRFGIVDYITKPFTREILTRKVARVLSSLSKRTGVVVGRSSAALLEQAQVDGRSGVLTVGGGGARLLVEAGRVVDSTVAVPEVGAHPGVFRELDPSVDHVVGPAASTSDDELGAFHLGDLPEAFRTALVVDDDAMFRLVLRRRLGKLGFTAYEAADGAEALKVALEKLPRLIVTDVRMPGMDGLELCRLVRGHSLLSRTPLVFLSGWDDYKDRFSTFEAGGDEFLSKQTSASELMIRICLIMGRYAQFGGAMRQAGAGLSGDLGLVGSPDLLQLCNEGKVTGTLTARSGTAIATVSFRAGEVVGAKAGTHRDTRALQTLLGWTRGRFDFEPGDPGPGAPLGTSFMQLLLDCCRMLDEQRRTDPEPKASVKGRG